MSERHRPPSPRELGRRRRGLAYGLILQTLAMLGGQKLEPPWDSLCIAFWMVITSVLLGALARWWLSDYPD